MADKQLAYRAEFPENLKEFNARQKPPSSIGKGEVESSILSGSTSYSVDTAAFLDVSAITALTRQTEVAHYFAHYLLTG